MYFLSFQLDDRVNYILGTDHRLSSKALPSKVLEFILSRNTIVSEHASISSRLKELGAISDNAEPSKDSVFNRVINAFNSININFITDEDIQTINTQIENCAQRFGIRASSLTIKGIAMFAYMITQGNGSSMDNEISQKFQEARKAELYLEEIEVIDLVTDPLSCLFLLMQLIPRHNSSLSYQDNIYKDGVITENILYMIEGSPKIFEARNKKWLSGDEKYDGIHTLHSKLNEAVFVVGFGHLFGKSGLLQALFKAGYTLCKYDDDMNKSTISEEDLILSESRALFNNFKYDVPWLNGYDEYEYDIITWTAIEDHDWGTLARIHQHNPDIWVS